MANNSELCPACRGEFTITYYQRRAADEPPDRVKYCKNCPLDPQRLPILNNSFAGYSEARGRDSVKQRVPGSRSSSTVRQPNKRNLSGIFAARPTITRTQATVVFRGNTARSCVQQCQENNCTPTVQLGYSTRVVLKGIPRIATVHTTGRDKGYTLCTVDSLFVAPFVSCNIVEVVDSASAHKQPTNTTILGLVYTTTTTVEDKKVLLHTSMDGSNAEVRVDFDNPLDENFDQRCISIVQTVFQQYGTESTLGTMVDSRLISAMFTQSARAFDSPVAPAQGYSYMWKPDGERYWCAKLGCVWFFCKRLLSSRVVGWRVDTQLTVITRAAPVLDLEVLIGHEPVLIDVLADEAGNVTSSLRNLATIIATFSQLPSLPVPVHVRNHYATIVDLQNKEPTPAYPIDGMVGIENSSTTIIKVKDVKSIELQLTDSGTLTASDGTVVATSTLHTVYPIDSIVEVRFRSGQDKSGFEILSTLLRTDKRKANDVEVCKEILSLAGSLPDNVARRKTLLWCNSIRRELHKIASSVRSSGRVVLDVGSGDGQAVSDYSSSTDITYLLVEPNLARCTLLRKRLSQRTGSRCYSTDSVAEVQRQLSSLSRGTLKYLIFMGTLEVLLENKQCLSVLKSCIRCCVASYSVSYTADSLMVLAIEGIEVVGCAYLYTTASTDGFLVKASGVKMQDKLNGTASVRWGSDKEYLEPVITAKKFDKIMNVIPAIALSPIAVNKSETLLSQVVASLFIVSTRRNF